MVLDYSKEQKETMFKNILDYVADTKSEEGIDAKIRPETIDRLTGLELNEDIVIQNNEELNKNFGYLSASYGFKDFHDFYLYAMSCAEEEIYEPLEKSNGSRKKDFSKLKQVKRTVTRNGKPTEMTFYEDPNKDSDEGSAQGANGEEEDTSPQPVDAKELRKATVGDTRKKVSMKELKALKDMHKAMDGHNDFNANAGSYKILADENNNIMGMVGFDYDEEYVTLVFEDSNSLVSNFDIRLFMELVNEALRQGLGIRTLHLGTRTFDILVEDHEIEVPEEVDGYYTLDKDKLLETYGYGD